MNKFLTLIAASAVALGAQAAAPDPTFFIGEVSLGQTYDLTAYKFKSVGATFTAPQSGELHVSNGDFKQVYVNEEWSDPIYPDGGNGYALNVEAGSTYYLYSSFMMQYSVPLELTMSSEFGVDNILPAEGAEFPVSGYTNCDVIFNQTLSSFSTPTITAGGVTRSLVARKAGDYQVSIEVGNVLLELMNQGVVKTGDHFTITITNIKSGDQLLGADGKLEISYVVPQMPVQCVDSSAPAAFLSYWMPGDPDGMVTLNYDGALDTTKGTCMLLWGNPEVEGGFYSETLPLTFKDNSVSVDLTGVPRRAKAMTASGTNFGTMGVQISGVCAQNGTLVVYSSEGDNTKTFNLPYKEVPTADVVAGFTPKNGGTLVGADNVEVYIMGLQAIQFDGFKFTTAKGDFVVPMSQVTVETGEDDDATYTVPIPAGVEKGKAVTLTLNNLLSTDGINRDKQLSAMYDTFVVLSSDPKDGAELYALNENQSVIINANMKDMYVEATLTDMNAENADDAILRSMIEMHPQEDGSYLWEVPAKITLYQNHQYRLSFSAWESYDASHYSEAVGTDYVTYNGQTAPYEYSPTQLIGIDPVPSVPISADQRVFTVKFDGLVSLKSGSTNNDCFIVMGQGATLEFASIEPVNPDGGMATEWKLTVPDSYFSADRNDLTLVINAFDPNGSRVEGNSGSEDTSCWRFEYTIAKQAQMCEIIVTPAAGTVTSLKEFTVTAANGQPIGPSWTAGNAAVYTKTMDLAATVTDAEAQEDGSCLLTLDAEVTSAGNYVLVIPEAYFLVGEQFSTWRSAAANVSYTIEGDEPTPEPAVNVVCDPAEGSTVAELSSITMTFVDFDEINIGSGRPSMTCNGQAADINDAQLDWNDYNKAIQEFNPALTANGVYVITYPEGYFTLGASGTACPEFKLTYVIGSVAINGIAADKSGRYEVYNLAGQRVLSTSAAADLQGLSNGFYIINGNKVIIRK